MRNFAEAHDRYLQPPEPAVAGKCAKCDADLYVGGDYLRDRRELEWYCDADCYVERLRDNGDLADETLQAD
jgi:hypothetical protein